MNDDWRLMYDHAADLERSLQRGREWLTANMPPSECFRNARVWEHGDDWCARCWRGIPKTHECTEKRVTAIVTHDGERWRLHSRNTTEVTRKRRTRKPTR